MLLPGVILLLSFNYLPMIGLLLAFKKINYVTGLWHSKWVGFDNFEFFISTPDAFRITRNTVLYNLAFMGLGLVFAVLFAIALSQLRNPRLSKLYQSALFLPYFLSWVVVSYLVFSFLSPQYGLVNRVFFNLFGKEPIDWYTTQGPWPYIIIFLNLWKYVGYNAIIYLAGITGIDKTYYESAAIDGATKWQQVKNITLPHLKPIMIIMTILSLGRIFNGDFGLFYQATLQLGNGFLKPVGDVIDTYVYSALIKSGDIGMASAAGFYQSIVGFVLVLTVNYIVRKINKEDSLF